MSIAATFIADFVDRGCVDCRCLDFFATFAASLYQDGAGARAKGMAGSGAAVADDPLSALFDNPAALSELDRPTIQFGGDAAFADGHFHNRANEDATMGVGGAIGEFAAVVPLGPVRFALGLDPDIALRDRWHYRDAPGGADGVTSYGVQLDSAEILLLRSAFGASWQVCPTLSFGANAGFLYNENRLQTPYVFQTQPVLRTAKTLLDLQTDGFGWNAQVAIRWQPSTDLDSQRRLHEPSNHRYTTDGPPVTRACNLPISAWGQPGTISGTMRKVENVFPQQVSGGLAWKATARLTLSAQFDWIAWSDAFDTLPVRLTRGNNADLNNLVGSNRLDDNVPLRWRDQYIGRLGDRAKIRRLLDGAGRLRLRQ